MVAELALRVQRTTATAMSVAQPRLAVYRPWVRPSIDEGWTRWCCFGTFRVLFNAALYSSRIAATVVENPNFWEPPEPEDEGASGAAGSGIGR